MDNLLAILPHASELQSNFAKFLHQRNVNQFASMTLRSSIANKPFENVQSRLEQQQQIKIAFTNTLKAD
jgi:hypothetical protein